MMTTAFHEDAYTEMLEAARYYEERALGLGFSFLDEVEAAAGQVLSYPEASPLVGREVRQKLLDRFPYSLIYAFEIEGIRIVAVAHQKRRPGYWTYRLG